MITFITFLGRSAKYDESVYSYGTLKSSPTKYTQEALLEILRKKSIEVNKFVIILTLETQGDWENGLFPVIRDILGEIEINPIVINTSNFSEDIIYEIFNKIVDVVNENDEVYLDITHSFRSIPVIGITAMQYLTGIKNVDIKSIFYGAYEAKKDDVVPVWDLRDLVNITDVTRSVWEWKNYGYSRYLQMMDNIPKELKKSFRNLEQMFLLTHAYKIYKGDEIIRMRERLQEIVNKVNPKLQNRWKDAVDIIGKFLEKIEKNNVRNIYFVSRFLWSKGHYHQALILLEEGLITDICERVKELNGIKDDCICGKDLRKAVNTELVKENYRGYKVDTHINELLTNLSQVKYIRNSLAHARTGDYCKNGLDLKKEEKEVVKEVLNKLLNGGV